MYPDQRALVEEIKREVTAELQRGGHSGGYGGREQPGGYLPPPASRTYQTIKDSVKEEVLAEIQMQQLDRMGLGRPLSEQKIQQMVDARYRAVDDLKADIKRELAALQEMEQRRSGDPQISRIAAALAEEARRQGIPHEQLIRSLDSKSGKSGGAMGRLSDVINTGQRKGFLCGVGAMLLCQLLLPSLRGGMHTVAVRSREEGMAMYDRARSFVSGSQQQGPPADPANPPAPPEGEQPPGGG